MTYEWYDSLKEIYSSFFIEQQEVQVKLELNLNKLSEINNYLKSMEEKEEIDYKIFSPRSVSILYKEEIEAKIAEKEKIEIENQNYYEIKTSLTERIKTLVTVLNIFENNCKEDIKSEDINKRLRVLDIQEKERQRIARDLHDTSLQNLTHLVHKIELSSLYIDKDITKAKLELAGVNKNLKLVIQEIRDTIFDLRPMTFDDLGLKDSFERLIIKLKEGTNFDFEYQIGEIHCSNSLILMTIFRIIEECLNNAVKHSGGNKIVFKFNKVEDDCIIYISDNGNGFDINEIMTVKKDKHFGLTILEERVSLLSGTLDIESAPGSGTAINIRIPLFV